MKTHKFTTPQEMVLWLMDNENEEIRDDYGRRWVYRGWTFYFGDLEEDLKVGIDCLHLYATNLHSGDL